MIPTVISGAGTINPNVSGAGSFNPNVSGAGSSGGFNSHMHSINCCTRCSTILEDANSMFKQLQTLINAVTVDDVKKMSPLLKMMGFGK